MTQSVSLEISRPACLSIIASAAEVFPKECMGSICCDAIKSDNVNIVTAFPYQIARRKLGEVTSESATTFDKLFNSGPFLKLGDYHSHPFQAFEKICPLGPSETDLKELQDGAIEVIVQIRRTRRKGNYWRKSKSGRLSIAWDRYRFLIAAFMRIPGTDDDGVPLYKKIALSFS